MKLKLKADEKKQKSAMIFFKYGRIYILSTYYKQYDERRKVLMFSEKDIPINELINSIGYKELEYTYTNMRMDTREAIRYIKIGNKIMKKLIEKDLDISYSEALERFKNPLNLTPEENNSLLKPIYTRYNKLKRMGNIEKVKRDLDNIDISKTKEIVFYNVPYELKDSRLKVIGDLWIDLREYIGMDEYYCISMGRVKKIDEIRIKFQQPAYTTFEIEIKEIILKIQIN